MFCYASEGQIMARQHWSFLVLETKNGSSQRSAENSMGSPTPVVPNRLSDTDPFDNLVENPLDKTSW